mgnify:CR=1 FL=1
MANAIGTTHCPKTKESKMEVVKRIYNTVVPISEDRIEGSRGLMGENYYIEFGKRILKTRKELNLSQDQLAMLWDISQTEVSLIEHGIRKANADQLFLLKAYEDSINIELLLGCRSPENDALDQEFRLLKESLNKEGLQILKRFLELIRYSLTLMNRRSV